MLGAAEPGAAEAEAEARLPPILLLADTSLLHSSIAEERWDGEESSDSLTGATHGKMVQHKVFARLVSTIREARPETCCRPLRAAFVGALSGDVPLVADAFRELVLGEVHLVARRGLTSGLGATWQVGEKFYFKF
jgi:hypothetical protein